MIDLSQQSGLEIALDPESGQLAFGSDVLAEDTGARTLGELAEVLALPDRLEDRADEVAYWLYRGVHAPGDADALAERGLRFDLTVTRPGTISGELIETAGHMHSNAPDGVGYPEIYEVLHGRAAFLLQFTDPLRVVVAVCIAGERILIPPGASHLSINIGAEPLVVADLVAIESQNDYGVFRERRGAALYLLREGERWAEQINPHYPHPPTWAVVEGSRFGAFPPVAGPLYTESMASLDDLHYLTAPAPWNPAMQALWDQQPSLR